MFVTEHKFLADADYYSQHTIATISKLNELGQILKTMVKKTNALGEAIKSKRYSGCIQNLSWDGDFLSVTETNDKRMEYAVWKRFLTRFPHIEHYWNSINLANNVYVTNDIDGRFFDAAYVASGDFISGIWERKEFSSIYDLLDFFSEFLNVRLQSYMELSIALRHYNEAHPNREITVTEVSFPANSDLYAAI